MDPNAGIPWEKPVKTLRPVVKTPPRRAVLCGAKCNYNVRGVCNANRKKRRACRVAANMPDWTPETAVK